MAANFPKTAQMLRENGYEVREINNTECAKIDGGMSCLSLCF
jgi:dimethylargininase